MSNSEWTNAAGTEVPEEFYDNLPAPTYWRLLIMPQAPEVVTQGGIILTSSNQDAQMYNTYVGKVMAIGPIVGKRSPINEAKFDIEVDDWVLYGKYAGQRIEYMGVKLIMINDEDILATVPDPSLLKVSV